MCIQLRFLCDRDFDDFYMNYIRECELRREQQPSLKEEFCLDDKDDIVQAVRDHLKHKANEGVDMFFVIPTANDWQRTHMRQGIPFTNI
jgi:hypothetical protein